MVRLSPALSVLLVLPLASACESSAPASTSVLHAIPTATDWAGLREAQADAPRAPPPAMAAGTWVLHIGDSFVQASFEQNLRPRFEASGTEYVVDATPATYTTTWASDPHLDRWLARHPSLVLVTLGANEVDMATPIEHARAVQRLVRRIGKASTSCVWITPPMWKADSGILQVIHDNSAPCLFLDSDAVLGGLRPGERLRDGIHPNERGGARWAAAVWLWLADHRDAGRAAWALVPFELRGS